MKKKSPTKRATFTVHDSSRKTFRKSTALKTAQTMNRLKARHEAEKKKIKAPKVEEYIPTQAELLEEAAITEKENILSLEKFQRLELEKKKTRPTKRVSSGPMVRYCSMTMPVIETDTEPPTKKTRMQEARDRETKRCERTFISFEGDIDNKVFDSIFKTADKTPKDDRRLCAITKLAARYFDPVTQLPYRNMQAFKIIREAYFRQLEETGNTESPAMQKWMEWRKAMKEQRKNKTKTG